LVGARRNVGLLSFGAEPEEPLDPSLAQTKFKSSHDVLTDDPRLRKEVIDDRGMSAQLPPELQGGGLAAAGSKRRGEDELRKEEVGRSFLSSGTNNHEELLTKVLLCRSARGRTQPLWRQALASTSWSGQRKLRRSRAQGEQHSLAVLNSSSSNIPLDR